MNYRQKHIQQQGLEEKSNMDKEAPLALAEGSDKTVLPLPPSIQNDARFEMEVYARFMGYLRKVPNSRLEIKILSAISFTADMLEAGEALVAKTLVDLGLRAPRSAFPASFLSFADRALKRQIFEQDSGPDTLKGLRDHWDKIGECRFEPIMTGDIATTPVSAYNTV